MARTIPMKTSMIAVSGRHVTAGAAMVAVGPAWAQVATAKPPLAILFDPAYRTPTR